MVVYKRENGKYGLHSMGEIVKIELWSEDIEPQELHFKIKGKGKFSYVDDFIAFSNNKRTLKRLKKKLKGIKEYYR